MHVVLTSCLEVIIRCLCIVQEQPHARLVHLHLFSVERLNASYLYRLMLVGFCLPIEPYQQRDKHSSKCQDGHVDDGVAVTEQPQFDYPCTPDAEDHDALPSCLARRISHPSFAP